MKKLISALLLLTCTAAFGAANDVFLNQRNPTDSGTVTRMITNPGANGIMGYSGSTNLPVYYTFGAGLSLAGSALQAVPAWADITGKPSFSAVATSGDYNDLSNKPSIPGAQVNADWAAASGVAHILNKPSLAPVATSGAYADLSGKPTIPAAQVNTDWNAGSGLAQLLNKPTTLAGYGITDAYPLTGNPSAFVNQAGARSAITLTTTGTSGAATYNSSSGVLNVPQYANSGGTVTSITAGAGLSGGVITTTGTISMPNTGTAGTYSAVTTDAQGRVTAGTTPSINNAPGRAIVTSTSSTGYQISSTRMAEVCYEGTFQTTSTIGGPAAITVFLETADTNSTTPGDWTIRARQTNSNTITLAVVLNQVDIEPWSICRTIEAGKYVRLRSGSVTGTATATINAEQQEVLQ